MTIEKQEPKQITTQWLAETGFGNECKDGWRRLPKFLSGGWGTELMVRADYEDATFATYEVLIEQEHDDLEKTERVRLPDVSTQQQLLTVISAVGARQYT